MDAVTLAMSEGQDVGIYVMPNGVMVAQTGTGPIVGARLACVVRPANINVVSFRPHAWPRVW
jgi:hypothetical protein